MSSISNASTLDKKNSIIKKKKHHFFSKKKAKNSDNQNLDISFISVKEDSNKTLFPSANENNEGDSSSLKQNKPEVFNKEISFEEKSILSKSEILTNNDVNLKALQDSMNDLDKKINEISNSINEKSNKWKSNHSEISEHLNCLMWQMNHFQKEQTELSQKLNEELNGLKESASNETKKLNEELNGVKESVSTETQKFNEELNGVKESVSTGTQKLNEKFNGVKECSSAETQKLNEEINEIKNTVLTVAKKTTDLESKVDELKLNTEKADNDNKEIKRAADENILQQKTELQNLSSKLNSLQAEFESIKEKVESLSAPPKEEPSPKKVDLSNIDDSVIQYITKCVQEKLEQQYKLKELEESTLKSQKRESTNDFDVKFNELSEKMDEFQIYQLSKEVELERMKMKLEDGMNQLNIACGKQIERKKNEREEMARKWDMENKRLNDVQINLSESITELKTTLLDLKKDVFTKLSEQQGEIENINRSTELLQKKSEDMNTIVVQKSVESKDSIEMATPSDISEKFDKLQQNIDSLNDEIQMLNMETKVMSTNISLIWDDVRTVKNFINQYDMNDKLKEQETNEEISEIYDQINDLKKKINNNN